MLVSEDDRDPGDFAQITGHRFGAHGGDVDRITVLPESLGAGLGGFISDDVQPPVRAFGHAT